MSRLTALSRLHSNHRILLSLIKFRFLKTVQIVSFRSAESVALGGGTLSKFMQRNSTHKSWRLIVFLERYNHPSNSAAMKQVEPDLITAGWRWSAEKNASFRIDIFSWHNPTGNLLLLVRVFCKTAGRACSTENAFRRTSEHYFAPSDPLLVREGFLFSEFSRKGMQPSEWIFTRRNILDNGEKNIINIFR